ncbi:MAG: formylmethanofuran dehydrogenase subunit E [Bellilinea sp.]|nr:MAG: formylmethanofuran dehydrogenase subunit E [Bellilinea sp.]
MEQLQQLLEKCAQLHHHLCPRQVLGVRMGLYAGRLLGLDLPQNDKRLYTIVETDGCGADGISVATNCWVGRRTLRVEDYGKVAATFIDTQSGRAVRLSPRPTARQDSILYAPQATSRWEANLIGYQHMPDEQMFAYQWVRLTRPIQALISQPGKRAVCDRCGEEIMNEREVFLGNLTLCRACAGDSYYEVEHEEESFPLFKPVWLSQPMG